MQVLNKRGPLGKVWLASHLERKLSKSVLLQTDIPNSVTAILGSGNDVVPVMALRLSGQLLLGVARIYSRKAKYLQDDCSEALVKIKLAFRAVPGANGLNGSGTGRGRGQRGDVDMTEEEAGRANINLNLGGDMRGGNDFDMLYNAEFGGFGIW
jgi:cohesin complex subunit SCC1